MSQLEIAADEQNEKNPSSWLDYTFLIFRQRMLAKKKTLRKWNGESKWKSGRAEGKFRDKYLSCPIWNRAKLQ